MAINVGVSAYGRIPMCGASLYRAAAVRLDSTALTGLTDDPGGEGRDLAQ